MYPDNRAVSAAMNALDATALEQVRVVELAPDATDIDRAIVPETGTRHDSVARDATGGAAGTAADAATAGAPDAVAPALFVSAPVVAALIVLGYGAMIGATAGAIRGLRVRDNVLAAVVKDALKVGYHVLILHAASIEARQRAETVIGDTLPGQTAHI